MATTPAHAQQLRQCQVRSASVMDFGRPGANPTVAVATTADLVIECEGNGSQAGAQVQVCVGVEPVAGRAMRRLFMPPPALRYEIYRDPAHQLQWGTTGAWLSTGVVLDGGTQSRPSGTTRVTLYGLLAPGQSGLGAGFYLDLFAGEIRASTHLGASCEGLATQDRFGALAIASLEGRCSVQAQDLQFGTANSLANALNATSQIRVSCTADTAYQVALDGGTVAGDVGARAMGVGATPPARIGYELRHGGPNGALWGDGSGGTTTVGGTGTGVAESITVFGRVPGGQATPAPGTYTDTVTVTVVY
ncbi:MAG: spore coat U domain-containing protein [Pseudomonadota bacterium]|nr:spore coat U domain-containing protein [Pseudomonadota bacterium]